MLDPIWFANDGKSQISYNTLAAMAVDSRKNEISETILKDDLERMW